LIYLIINIRLLGDDQNAKSRFESNNINSMNGQNYQRNLNPNGSNINLEYNTLNSNHLMNNSSLLNSNIVNNNNTNTNNLSETNQMFEKIMSEVIHVSAFEQRGNINSDISSHPVQDMPLKIKGLLEPVRQNLTLPEGVPAPVTVLSAQPPFTSDIRLINSVALDAQRCMEGYCLNVPENVAFDFNPVA
jgi:hypothetical protein